MPNHSPTRRDFLRTAAGTACALTLPCKIIGAEKTVSSIPYEPELRDRLWMWGHGAGSTDDLYNIPKGHGIDEADAIRSMGIPNVCVIRWRGLPAPENAENDPARPPFDRFIRQFGETRRVAWSVIDGAPEPYPLKKSWAFELSRLMPKLTTIFLDDFFKGDAIPAESGGEAPAHLTLNELARLRTEAAALSRPLEVAAVLYSNQLHPAIHAHLELCDTVSFWTWKATDLVNMEENFARYREILPGKPTLLGVYMWDFGNSRPITPELMNHQLEVGLDLFHKGEIEGMIFHCTPLCDLGLEAVEMSRRWIKEHGSEQKKGTS